jgi:hypothetical protein
MKDLRQKDFNAVLLETSDFFKSQGINIIGEGYKEIATNPALFESYVEALTEGASADQAAVIGQLMANTNAGILRESSLSGIAPIASLSMPVIRKLWPKYALKEVFKTEVAKTPRFVVSYMRPYIYKGTGARIYLPKGLVDNQPGETVLGSIKDKYITATVTIAKGASLSVDFGASAEVSGVYALSQYSGLNVGQSATTRQSLDSEFRLVSVAGTLSYDADGTGGGAAVTAVATTGLNRRLDVAGTIVADVTLSASVGGAVRSLSGQVIVRVDLQAGTALVAAVGFATTGTSTNPTLSVGNLTVVLKAGVSTEFNEEGYSVGFDIARLDIDIPTGQHLNAPLPIEALNDMMALYQIDGTKETVDLMTNVFATRLDLEALAFLNNSFDNQPGVAEFAGYPAASAYQLVFDVRPAAGFAGSPKAWREELKPQIDFLAQKIKNQTYLQAGIFTIVGNPLNIQLLTNVDWQFRGGQGSNMDGVDVDYSVGTYVGANAYRVIASVNVPVSDGLFLVFTPNSDTQMTYKYYPYTFSTEMGYIDPNRSRVPSIMMTKRHTFAEFLPAIGNISIVNNTGIGQFTEGYWPAAEDADTPWGQEG